MKSPADDLDPDDYDDIAQYIADAMEIGFTIEASDFEGRPCSYCGDLISFAEVMQDPDHNIPTYDIEVHDPEENESTGLVDRHYFCSRSCKQEAKSSMDWMLNNLDRGEPDRLDPTELEADR